MRAKAEELADLWTAIDEATGGALYALRYECESNGWTPHLWSQTPAEGAPCGLTRFLFFGADAIGKIVYWDTATIRDPTGLGPKIKISETLVDARRARERIKAGLERLARGLNPISEVAVEVRGLN